MKATGLTADGLRGVCTYVSPQEAKPGDLIFFQGTYNTSGASDPENDEMIEIINSTVGKLQQIEDKYYYSLDLNYYLNNLENDAYEA